MAGRHPWRAALVATAVVAAVAVPAVALQRVAQDAADRADQGVPPTTTLPAVAPAAATPVLSARRIPGVVTGKLATASLLAGADQVAQATPATGCLSVALDGVPLYELRPDDPLIPASNQKLVTAAVALDVLGPDHRFVTTVVGPGVDAAGTVRGDLTVVGGGDPLLTTQPYLAWLRQAGKEVPAPVTSYEALADALVAAGVRRVEGSVVGQEGRYDTVRRGPTWPASYRLSLEGGPLSSLLVNDGFSSFAPVASTTDPAAHAAAVLTGLLRERGVAVAGAARSGTAPAGAGEVARVESPALAQVVAEMLTSSDNNTAELLLKEIGVARGRGGSTAAGAAVVGEVLTSWGVPTAGVVVADGSGLDRANRATCRQLLAVLQRGGEPVAAGLAVAGETGTLADALRGNPAEGRLRGKTGTLTGVKSLTGLMDTEGHRLQFAYVLNAPNAEARALPQWARLGSALASYPDRPDLAPFLPRPPVTAPGTSPPPTAS